MSNQSAFQVSAKMIPVVEACGVTVEVNHYPNGASRVGSGFVSLAGTNEPAFGGSIIWPKHDGVVRAPNGKLFFLRSVWDFVTDREFLTVTKEVPEKDIPMYEGINVGSLFAAKEYYYDMSQQDKLRRREEAKKLARENAERIDAERAAFLAERAMRPLRDKRPVQRL